MKEKALKVLEKKVWNNMHIKCHLKWLHGISKQETWIISLDFM
jgi:hypothetical protein